MSAKRYTDAEKLRALDEVEAGGNIAAQCRKYGISRSTLHRWQKRFQSDPSPARPVAAVRPIEPASSKRGRTDPARELEEENVRLRRIVVQQALRIDALEGLLGRHGGES